MRKVLILTSLLLVLAAAEAAAQGLPTHWSTAEACQQAVSAPFYYPAKPAAKRRPLAKDEVVLGHPTGSCIDMDLPEASGGRGWVRIEPGRRVVYNRITGKPVRLEECENPIYGEAPFAPPRAPQVPAPSTTPISDALKVSGVVNHVFSDPIRFKLEGAIEAILREQREAVQRGPNFFSFKRKSGQIFWPTAIGLAIGGGFLAAHLSRDRVEVTQIVNQ